MIHLTNGPVRQGTPKRTLPELRPTPDVPGTVGADCVLFNPAMQHVALMSQQTEKESNILDHERNYLL